MAKLTVMATDYKEHQPVETEGTPIEAIRAFQKARGLDGLNLNYRIISDNGAVVDVTSQQAAALAEQWAKEHPSPELKPVSVDPAVVTESVAKSLEGPKKEPKEKEEPKHHEPAKHADHHKKQ